jgi:hypothetical protein
MSLLESVQSIKGTTQGSSQINTQPSGSLLQNVKIARKEVTPTPIPVKPIEQPKLTFTQKAGDFVKNFLTDLKAAKQYSKNVEGLTKTFIKEKAVKPIVETVKKDISTTKEALGKQTYNTGLKGTLLKLSEVSTIPTLERAKQNVELKKEQGIYISPREEQQYQQVLEFLKLSPEQRALERDKVTKLTQSIKTERLAKSAYVGVVSTTKGVLNAYEWISGKDTEASKNLDQWIKRLNVENPTLVNQIQSGAGSTIPFYAFGGIFGLGAKTLAKVSPKIATLFASGASGALEAMTEAGNVYDDNLKQGKTKAEAGKAADKTFGANLILNILTNKLGVFGDKEGLNKLIMSVSGEGIQEAVQQIISNSQTGRDLFDGVAESGLIGAIIGSAGSFISLGEGNIVNKLSDKASNSYQAEDKELSKEDVKEITDYVKKNGELETVKVSKNEDGTYKILDGVKTLEFARQNNLDIQVEEVTEPQKEELVTVYRTAKKLEEGNQVSTDKEVAQRFATENEPVIEFKIPKSQLEESPIQVKKEAGIMTYIGKEVKEPTPKGIEEKVKEPKAVISPSIPEVKPKVKEKEVSVPREQIPVGEGKTKVSKLEARVTDQLKKISQESIDKLGLATYNELNKKENIKLASEYVLQNPDEAIKVLTGEIEAPKGILRNAIYVAMENMAKGDVELARRLASITSTRLGQELSILTEIDQDSPVKAMRDIIQIKEETFKRRYKNKKVGEVKKKLADDIKKDVKKVNNSDWSSFIDSIKC